MLARWREAKLNGRSKWERIENKMGEAQCGVGEHKKVYLWAQVGEEREDTLASQKYTPVLRARGV
jgi:hypothetical protein